MKKNNLLLIFLFCISFVSAQKKEIIASSQPITINITTSLKEITGNSVPTAINIPITPPPIIGKKTIPILYISKIGSREIETGEQQKIQFETEEKEIILKGFLKQGEQVSHLSLNDDGDKFLMNQQKKTFSTDDDQKISLSRGNNKFIIKALDNQNQVLASWTINIRLNVKETGLSVAKYYAILIACNQYKNENALQYPIQDAQKLAKVLKEKYNFSKIETLENPKDKLEVETFLDKFNQDNLKEIEKENNNVVIFYAGHGIQDSTSNNVTGYWIPKEGNKNQLYTLVNTKSLQTEILSQFNAKHILTIVDACYSGAICNREVKKTKELSISDARADELYSTTSRYAMTSGQLKPVPDKSVFINGLLFSLENNKDKKLSSEMLHLRIKLNSPSESSLHCPLIKDKNQQGEFIFQLKKTK